MATHNTLEVCRRHLFDTVEDLSARFPDITVRRVIRIRDAYNYILAHPEAKDREITEHILNKEKSLSRSSAYADLSILKQLLPLIAQNSREFHRWRYQEMIMETYRMAKRRGDTKTMERCATSYAKYTKIDTEDEISIQYELLRPQPFVPTLDVSVLDIKPIPNVYERIDKLTRELSRDIPEIMDVQAEEADLQEDLFFPTKPDDKADGEPNIL